MDINVCVWVYGVAVWVCVCVKLTTMTIINCRPRTTTLQTAQRDGLSRTRQSHKWTCLAASITGLLIAMAAIQEVQPYCQWIEPTGTTEVTRPIGQDPGQTPAKSRAFRPIPTTPPPIVTVETNDEYQALLISLTLSISF